MAKASTSSAVLDVLNVLATGFGKVAEGIGTDYQSVLMQDTGWRMPSQISDMTQDRAQDISKGMLEEANSPSLEAEREM